MEKQAEFTLSFEGISVADANRLAQDLERELKKEGVQVSRCRGDESSQDFGATLVMVLGAPAVVVAARALRAWVTRKNAGSLTIVDGKRKLIAANIESEDVAALAKAFAKSIEG